VRNPIVISPNKNNLRSKKKEEKSDQPLMVEKPTKQVENITKEKKTQNLPSTAKDPISEVREIPKPPSSFSFEKKIKKIRIPVPLSELVKNEHFKRSLYNLL
jgi:hypothetical protein